MVRLWIMGISVCRYGAVISFFPSALLTATLLFPTTIISVYAAQIDRFDGPAQLPRAYVRTSLADSPSRGRNSMAAAGSKLQQVINEAACGDTIRLQAGASFTGRFIFPPKKCDDSSWITIRTSAPDSALPPEGTRISPCYAGVSSLPARPTLNCSSTKNVLAKIVYPLAGGTSGPIGVAPGASHYRLLGLEITRSMGTG